jgi:hypothetical protein
MPQAQRRQWASQRAADRAITTRRHTLDVGAGRRCCGLCSIGCGRSRLLRHGRRRFDSHFGGHFTRWCGRGSIRRGRGLRCLRRWPCVPGYRRRGWHGFGVAAIHFACLGGRRCDRGHFARRRRYRRWRCKPFPPATGATHLAPGLAEPLGFDLVGGRAIGTDDQPDRGMADRKGRLAPLR